MPLPAMWKWNGQSFLRAEDVQGFFARHAVGAAVSSIPLDPALFAGYAEGCLTNPKMNKGISGGLGKHRRFAFG